MILLDTNVVSAAMKPEPDPPVRRWLDEQAVETLQRLGIDVTDPEPPAADSPLRTLPNVVLTPHIAGCIENCNRMGELAVEELRRHFAGEPAVYEITPDMFDRIA